MKNLSALLLLALVGLQTATAAHADEKASKAVFKASKTEGYKPVSSALKALVQEQRQPVKGVQHFCVIGYEPVTNEPKTERTAWVHWIEGRRLVQWSSADVSQGFTSTNTLLHSSRQLDLDRDVVATQEDIGSSTYLVDRQWVNTLLADCRLRGERFQLRRR